MTLERGTKCPNCGTHSWEWAEDPYAYDPMHVHCPGCARREALADDKDTPMPKGTTVRLIPKETAARLRESAQTQRVQRPKLRRG